MTARDLLTWAIDQGVFTESHQEERETVPSVVDGIPGPWVAVMHALVDCLGERLAAAITHDSSAVDREYGGMSWQVVDPMFADVGRLDAGRVGAAFALDQDQQTLIPALMDKVRLFFDGTVTIGGGGLDAPVRGDISYHTWFDYEIDVPAWASYWAD